MVVHSTPPGCSVVTPLMYFATVSGSVVLASVTASAVMTTAS